MATNYTLTRNLRLRIDSNLTAGAKSNLEKLDLLGSTFLTDSTSTLRIRSASDISIEPESPDLGGTALGGTLTIGSASHILSSVQIWSSEIRVASGISLLDQGVAPTVARSLSLRYLSSPSDILADRILTLDPQGADRTLTLGGSLTLSGGSLTLGLVGSSSVVLPLSGTLATLAGAETLTNKIIDASQNTIQGLNNSSIAPAAGISYSKLSLAGSILDSDVATGASIAYGKLALSNSILLSDLQPSIAIPYTYLDLFHSLQASDLSPGIQIPGDQVVPNFQGDVTTHGSLILSGPSYDTTLSPSGSLTSNLEFVLPSDTGSSGQILQTDGLGGLSWVDKVPGGSMVTGVAFNWITSDGTSLTLAHGLSSVDIDVSVLDITAAEKIMIDQVTIIDANTITVSASEAPAGTWRVIIQGQ